MARDPLAGFYVHTLSVETFRGKSGSGDDLFENLVICSPLTQTGVLVQGERKQVRAANGDVVTSHTTVYAPLALAPLFTLDSRVTINQVPARVLAVNQNDLDGRFPQHLEVHLT